MNGREFQQLAIQQGASPEELRAWQDARRVELGAEGKSSAEIDEWLGLRKKPKTDQIKEFFREGFAMEKLPRNPAFLEAWKAGYGNAIGIPGLGGLVEALREGEGVVKTLDAHTSMFDRLTFQAGHFAGDLPFMMAGSVAGAGTGLFTSAGTASIPLAFAGGFALPAALRHVMMNQFKNGEIDSIEEFWPLVGGTFLEALKGYGTGLATGGTAVGLKAIGAPAAVTWAGEIAAMTTVGSAMEGHMPRAQDFLDNALLLGAIKVSFRAPGVVHRRAIQPVVKSFEDSLRRVYAWTGRKPDEVVSDIRVDPSIAEDLLSVNRELPRAYEGERSEQRGVPLSQAERAGVELEEAATVASRAPKVPKEPRSKEEINEAIRELKDEAAMEGPLSNRDKIKLRKLERELTEEPEARQVFETAKRIEAEALEAEAAAEAAMAVPKVVEARIRTKKKLKDGTYAPFQTEKGAKNRATKERNQNPETTFEAREIGKTGTYEVVRLGRGDAPLGPAEAPRAAEGAREPWQMTAREFFHPTFNRGAIDRFEAASEGEIVGTIGDFIHGRLTREALGEVLDVPVMRLDTPVQGGKRADLPAGVEFKGASGTFDGNPTVFIKKTGDFLTTLYEEAAHQMRVSRGRPMTKQDITRIDLDAYKGLPEEVSAERFVAYLKKLGEREAGHRELVERALAEGKPVPPEVLAEYPDLAPTPRAAEAEVLFRADSEATKGRDGLIPLTGSREIASNFASEPGAKVSAYNVDVKNPLEMVRPKEFEPGSEVMPEAPGVKVIAGLDAKGDKYAQGIINSVKENGTFGFWENTRPVPFAAAWRDILIPQLRKLGFDGIRYADAPDTGPVVAVFSRDQLRAAGAKGKSPGEVPTSPTPRAEGAPAEAEARPSVIDELKRAAAERDEAAPTVPLAQRAGRAVRYAIGRAKPLRLPTELERDVETINRRIDDGRGVPRRRWRFDDFVKHWFDKNYRMHKAVDDMMKSVEAVGEKVDITENPYELNRVRAAASAKGTTWVEYGQIEQATNQIVGKGLKEILYPIRERLDQFRSYITSKRVLELEERSRDLIRRGKPGIEHGFDAETAARVVRGLEGEMEAVRAEMYEWTTSGVRYARDAGLISPELYEAMLEMNRSHVPFYRIFEEGGGFGDTGRGANIQARNPYMRIMGIVTEVKETLRVATREEAEAKAAIAREKNPDDLVRIEAIEEGFEVKTMIAPKIQDPIASAIQNMYAIAELADKNEVALRYTDLAMRAEEARSTLGATGQGETGFVYAEKAPRKQQPIQLSAKEQIKAVGAVMKAMGREVDTEALKAIEAQIETTMSIFRPMEVRSGTNQIVVHRNGKKELWNIDPEVWESFAGGDRVSQSLFMRIAEKPARWLRATAVLTPSFIGRNPARDQLTMFVYSDSGAKPILDLASGIHHLAKKDAAYWAWMRSGGPQAALVSMDMKYIQRDIRQILDLQKIPERMINIVKSPIHALQVASSTMEAGTRVGVFAKTAGIKRFRETTEADIAKLSRSEMLRAGLESREATLDFAMKGTAASAWNRITAFHAASLASHNKMFRSFRDHPGRTTARAIGAISVPSILLQWYHIKRSEEDPEYKKYYKEVPAWQKKMAWVVPSDFVGTRSKASDLTFWRVPKPWELGVLFGTGAEEIFKAVYANDPKAFDDYFISVGQAFTPSYLPTALVPVAEAWADKSLFTGRPRIPASREKGASHYQYTPYTTELTKALAKGITQIPGIGRKNVLASPPIIDGFIRGWTAGLGQHVWNLLDASLRAAGKLPERVDPPKTWADYPFIKGFAIRFPTSGSESVIEFFKKYEEATERMDTIGILKRSNELSAMVEEVKMLSGRDVAPSGIHKTVMGHLQAIRGIWIHPTMQPEEKAQLLDQYTWQMIGVARSGVVMMDNFLKTVQEKESREAFQEDFQREAMQ